MLSELELLAEGRGAKGEFVTGRFSGVRKPWLLFVVVLGVLVAGACAGSTPDEGGGEAGGGELVWAIGGAEAAPGGVHRTIAQMWNEENPDNPIRIERLPDAADEQRQQQSLELNAQGDLFDVLGVDVIWTGEYSTNGWLESLEDIRSDIEEVTIPGAFESGQWGGELWAAPYNSNAGFLYYRTDLVDEPPTTWDELQQVGLQIGEQEGIAPFVGQGAKYEGFVVNWLEYYWSAGGELYNEDNTEVLFDDEIALQATEFMRESLENGFYAPGFNTLMEEEARNEFQSGNAVFMRQWPYAYALMNDEKESKVAGKFDIAPLPTFTGEGTISALGGFNNAVSAFSTNKEAAKEFVLWASTNPEVQMTMATKASLPPTMASVYEDLSDDPVMALLGEVLPDAKPRPPAPQWNNISVEIQEQIFPAYNGEGDPAEAVSAVHEFLDTTVE
jgi:multiple sugar transport system substrate-binding protein